ncbi:MAG TPA: thioredoxin family protein [Saprospiraceae bacterium]|nr:thioredoxin family protein [Saprospirales bacterium]HRQ29939.1 thioredoxin family protein [Saprospiraceae bacterium]
MKKLFLLPLILLSLSIFAQDSYKIGDQVMPFKLKNVDNSQFLVSPANPWKGYIIVFTCNHCPFSVLYEDRLIQLDKKFRPLGFPVVAINSNDAAVYAEDSFENMVIRSKEKGFTFPYLHDETQEFAKKFGATRTPHVFVVHNAPNGKLLLEYIGAIDDNAKEPENVSEKYVELAVNALLEGKEVEVKNTKAIGCSIKWKE